MNNPDFENYLGQMYPTKLEIKNMTESKMPASYLDKLLQIGMDGQLHTLHISVEVSNDLKIPITKLCVSD